VNKSAIKFGNCIRINTLLLVELGCCSALVVCFAKSATFFCQASQFLSYSVCKSYVKIDYHCWKYAIRMPNEKKQCKNIYINSASQSNQDSFRMKGIICFYAYSCNIYIFRIDCLRILATCSFYFVSNCSSFRRISK